MRKLYIFSFIQLLALAIVGAVFVVPSIANADLTLTSGNNATTTPSVATSITGFQIVGPAASTTPVKLFVTSGTLNLSTVSGVTMSGNNTATVNLSGTVANLNTALSTLTYTRGSTGTDTLEVALVNSNQIYFPTNGHVYQYVSGTISWNSAKPAAELLTAYGAAGYLVTITSSAENAFVKDRLSGDAWIGGSDSETEGTWKWVTGPEAGTTYWQGTSGGSAVGGNYASWSGGEPNQSGEEDCAETYISNGSWNDLPCSATVSGYVAEFGTPSTLPNVVSKNVSIVTADVPAVTSLSPANASTSVATTSNLVIGFSKSVTKQTGNIVIYKVADNSVVESISAAGSQVSGSGTNSITIDPSVILAEGIQYYVIVPDTAFKDSSNNFFGGITASSTWVFTTRDATAPVISSVVATPATTTASITWTTNEAASTRAVYSIASTFASTTSETDTSPRVTSHIASLTGLVACTTYNYKVASTDGFSNTATSTSALFTTLGCPGSSVPTAATTTSVTVASAATSTLTDSGRTMSVATPANVTATSSTIVIQIRAQESDAVLGSLGQPSGVSSAAEIVFDVTALVNSSVVLDSFNAPVTITYTYTDVDIAGLDESTLVMYHYHAGAWVRLNDCSVDTANNTITCTTQSFSVFAIFGSPVQSSSGSTGGRIAGDSIQNQVDNLMAMGKIAEANALKAQWYWLFPGTPAPKGGSTNPLAASAAAAYGLNGANVTGGINGAIGATGANGGASAGIFTRDLQLNMIGDDVLALQKFLNANGFKIAASGPGSPGKETNKFGPLTKQALIKYQKAKGIKPAVGYFGPVTKGSVMMYFR